MYVPYICTECHVELVSNYHSDIWTEKTCPICDGTDGEYDLGYVKHKDLDRDNLALLRFVRGKSPQK